MRKKSGTVRHDSSALFAYPEISSRAGLRFRAIDLKTGRELWVSARVDRCKLDTAILAFAQSVSKQHHAITVQESIKTLASAK